MLAPELSLLKSSLSGKAGVWCMVGIPLGASCLFVSFLLMWANLHPPLSWNGHPVPLLQDIVDIPRMQWCVFWAPLCPFFRVTCFWVGPVVTYLFLTRHCCFFVS